MLKKLGIAIMFSFAVSQLAYAKFIELNNHNPEICKQQLLSAGDTKPIIFMNIKGLKLSEDLQSVYKQVSRDYPKKAFFTFNVDESHPDAIVAKTAEACLDAKSLDTPYVYAYIVAPTTKKLKGYFIAADNMKLSDNSTKQDIVKFLSL